MNIMDISEYFALMKKALLSPEKAFRKYKLSVGESITYYTILLLINNVLAALFFPKILMVSVLLKYSLWIIVILNIIVGIVGVLIGSAWLHLFVMLFGGKGYRKTLAASVIASTPLLLFGWIPFVGAITWLWIFVLLIIGISIVHKFSTVKSLLVILISGIIPLLILLLFAFLVYSSIASILKLIMSVA